MIRINLLSVERERAKKKITFQSGQKLAIGCSLILILAVVFIGWRYWTVTRDSTRLDEEISKSQSETTRLHSIIQQVQEFEQRKAQLQQRVVLIEQLRKGQTGPVHMLEQVSRSLPPMLWLTELKQVGADVVMDGNCTTLTGLSDFVGNLEASGYFKRSIEIVSTTTEILSRAPGELIKFTIKAQFQRPGETAAPPAGAAPPAKKVGG
jgi:type IV pilus assembly protein PilN